MSQTQVERGAVAAFGVLARGTNDLFSGPWKHLAVKTRPQLHSSVVRRMPRDQMFIIEIPDLYAWAQGGMSDAIISAPSNSLDCGTEMWADRQEPDSVGRSKGRKNTA